MDGRRCLQKASLSKGATRLVTAFVVVLLLVDSVAFIADAALPEPGMFELLQIRLDVCYHECIRRQNQLPVCLEPA